MKVIFNKAYVNEQVVVKNYSSEEFSVWVKIIRNRPVLFSVLDVALTLDLLHDDLGEGEKMIRFDKIRQFLGDSFFISNEMVVYTFLPLKEIEQLVFAYENEQSEKFQRWFVCELLPTVELDFLNLQSKQDPKKAELPKGLNVEASHDDIEAFEIELMGLKHSAEVMSLDKNTRYQMLVHIYKKYGVPFPIPAVGITK